MDIAKAGTALLHLDTAGVGWVGRALKRRWMRNTFPHGNHYQDEIARFNRLYLVPDPWTMNCERERFRYRETNRLILENFGHSHTLLEIGCGEGLQSSQLQEVCDHLHSIDVSTRAVRRAKRRCPLATFTAGDMYSLPQPSTRFDLVVACEVLFYISDVAGALNRMSQLGRACLVSYYHAPRAGLDKHVRQIPGVQFEFVSCEDVSWTFAWWRP